MKTKIGYEIPFTREFYKYVAPRKSEDIFAHLKDSLLMLAIIFVVIPAANLKSSFLISRSNSVCQSGL